MSRISKAIKALLFRLTANRPCRIISRDGAPYLERYFLFQALGLTVYLHRFVSGDGDEEVHNHPWNAASLCLVGGYTEERASSLCMMSGWVSTYRCIFPGRLNIIRANDFHRITRATPDTWTLFTHGRLRIGWGFLAPLKDTETGLCNVLFHQPYPLTNGTRWWVSAPFGAAANREPLQ